MKSPGEDHPVEAVPSPCDKITGKIIVSTSPHITDLWRETFLKPCLPGPGHLSGKRTIKLIKQYVLCVLCRIIVFVAANAFFMMKEGATTNKQTNQEADKLQTYDIKLAATDSG